MKNGIKSTQDLIMHLLKKKNPFQKDINNKNTNLLLNHKKNLFQHNSLTKIELNIKHQKIHLKII